jgi:hypothetical protein
MAALSLHSAISTPPDASFCPCSCALCIQAAVVQRAYLQRQIDCYVSNEESLQDFNNLDKFLDMIRANPFWLHHMSPESDYFSFLCAGMCILIFLFHYAQMTRLEIDEKLEVLATQEYHS